MDLKVEALYKTYSKPLSKKKFEAVKNISFEIATGEIYALLGPNGAGKSTTIKMIAGLITPTSGKILFNNSAHKNYQVLSAVLEGSRNVYWRLTPLENLHYFANLRGVPSRQIKEKSELLLKELEIDAKKANQSRHLSRGMLQKLAIAAALITDPQILLLDEPTLGVDVASARNIKEKIRSLAKKEGKSVLLTTHQLDLVDQLADRVGIIQNGNLVREGTIEELKKISQNYLYHISIQGKFKIPAEWKKIFIITEIKYHSEITEFEVDCKTKTGMSSILEYFSKNKLDIIFLQKKRDNLEEVFLRSLESKSGVA
ncbi:MAG: ABC transporter ATP-binding protein [Spirochaetia bacterium]|nr:ABC transporter ATP-binding protein [Spirochaetia bacterium]